MTCVLCKISGKSFRLIHR